MNPYGRGPRLMLLLLPLLVGVGLGAMIFGGPRGPRLYNDRGEFGPRYYSQPAAPAAPAQPAQPQAAPQAPAPGFEARRDEWRDEWRGGYGKGRHDHMFFPFAGFRLLLPLLLIGTGAWLLFGRRRGPGRWGGGPGGWGNHHGPQPAQPGTPPAAPYAAPGTPPPAGPYTAPPTPTTPPTEPPSGQQPPATGETRLL